MRFDKGLILHKKYEMEEHKLNKESCYQEMAESHRRGKIMGGLLIVTVGSLFLAREMGAILPAWLFTWKTLLIGIGIVTAVKHKFKHASWILLIGIGSIFLLNDFYPELHIKPIIWPVIIIFIGLFIMFKPRRQHYFDKNWKHYPYNKWNKRSWEQPIDKTYMESHDEDNENRINATSIMGGIEKNVYSKNFKGGEITTVFGGAEINLLHADIETKADLEITQVFGGTKLIVPANWNIKSELVSVLGGIEDKRPRDISIGNDQQKILYLTGTVVFGGIEITSI